VVDSERKGCGMCRERGAGRRLAARERRTWLSWHLGFGSATKGTTRGVPSAASPTYRRQRGAAVAHGAVSGRGKALPTGPPTRTHASLGCGGNRQRAWRCKPCARMRGTGRCVVEAAQPELLTDPCSTAQGLGEASSTSLASATHLNALLGNSADGGRVRCCVASRSASCVACMP
jgi:hypothetical protein